MFSAGSAFDKKKRIAHAIFVRRKTRKIYIIIPRNETLCIQNIYINMDCGREWGDTDGFSVGQS